jgi:hypothetical protein
MGEKSDKRAVLGGLVALARPSTHALSVGRIAEDDVGTLIASEAVILLGEIGVALRVVDGRARV